MVESQAVARVLRIGQRRDVKVTRYIVKGTVEEVRNIAKLYRKQAHTKAGNAITTAQKARFCKIGMEGRLGLTAK